MSDNKYEVVMGLEIHARINTKTKMFCACDNDIFTADPNANTCSVCMGHPGMLPVVNAEAYRKGILTGLALGCNIPEFSKFDRKSYFYPDLPLGYQISQFDEPVAVNGKFKVEVEGKEQDFGITRLHLENDAGKLTHTVGGTLVDYNRSGTPLMEIVTEPDFRSVSEVTAFLKELQRVLRYVNTSQADMEKGMMRCDVNVSIRPFGQKEFGTRAEIKNMNSFRMIEKAVNYEIKRQTKEIEAGNKIIQETRGWDDVKNITVSQRGKEDAMDYRYFPEPDLPPMTITGAEVDEIAKDLPELPLDKRKRLLEEYALQVNDADTLVCDADLADYFEEVAKKSGAPNKAANWILSELLKHLNEDFLTINDCKITADNLAEMIKMVEDGTISGKIAKEILPEMYADGTLATEIVEKKGLKQMSDTGELEEIVQGVLDRNQKIVEDYKGGKDKALGALVGQVMGATKGQANPKMVNEIILKLITN